MIKLDKKTIPGLVVVGLVLAGMLLSSVPLSASSDTLPTSASC